MNDYTTLNHSGKNTLTHSLAHSGKNNPCPICDRTKDADCSWTHDLQMVLCHTLAVDPLATVRGYQFRKLASSGIHGDNSAAMYVKTNEQKAIRKASRNVYTYTLKDGLPLVRVVRIDDGNGKKKIFQQHYLNREWFDGVPTPTRPKIPLYRIYEHDNQQAISQGKPLLIVEGEGKVDLLMNMGIAATCSIGGAGKWVKYGHESYVQNLQGANVVIVPDRDKPGMEHALTIAQDFPNAQWLYPFPDSPLWDNLPKSDGLDIADWVTDYRLSSDEIYAAIGPKREPVTPISTSEPVTPTPTPEPTVEAPKLLICYDRVNSALGDKLRYNTLFKQVELDGIPLEPPTAKLELAIKHRLSLNIGRDDVADIVTRLAKLNSYSPVVNYLNQVAEKHGNDASILRGFTDRYLGTSDRRHQKQVIRFLIAAVARAFQPGCKHDSALIFQGNQYIGKSSFFRVLASEEWFDDSLGAMSDKDERLKLHRAWFVEWAELESVFKRRELNSIKAFMTCAIDQVRPPYGRSVETMKRPSVICGTANEEELLIDPTGNRRFWVVPVSKWIDQDALHRERDRIWAAVVALYRAGNRWHFKPHENLALEVDRQAYNQVDPWHAVIEKYCEIHSPVSTGELLSEVLRVDLKDHDQLKKRRVTAILKRLGWKQLPNARVHLGNRQRVWEKSAPTT